MINGLDRDTRWKDGIEGLMSETAVRLYCNCPIQVIGEIIKTVTMMMMMLD